jgi:hypothetical protein
MILSGRVLHKRERITELGTKADLKAIALKSMQANYYKPIRQNFVIPIINKPTV